MSDIAAKRALADAPIFVLILGMVVTVYAFAWYFLFLLIGGSLLVKVMTTPVFVIHLLLGVGVMKGWKLARLLVLIIASFGLLGSVIVILFRGQSDPFLFYLVGLFFAAVVILNLRSARSYFKSDGLVAKMA